MCQRLQSSLTLIVGNTLINNFAETKIYKTQGNLLDRIDN